MNQQNVYNKNYYLSYYLGDFEKRPRMFARKIASQIVENYNPKSVLEIGCAFGFLTSALRELGVEAYGIDFSEYAISQIDSTVKDYINLQSVTEDLPEHFPKKFDLVLSLQLLEHLYEEEGLLAINKMCSYTDAVLFSSNPNAVKKDIHINIQQPPYWSKQFANQGFFSNPCKAPLFIKPYALYFYKTNDMVRVAEDFERSNCQKRMSYETVLTAKKQKLSHLTSKLMEKTSNEKNLNIALASERAEKNAVLNSTFWKLTKPFRASIDLLKRFVQFCPVTRYLYIFFKSVETDGFKIALKKIRSVFLPLYYQLSTADKNLQTSTTFDKDIKFSILVPLYNTPKKFLTEMIESVQKQTYKNWELCLADGSTADFAFVEKICKKYAKKDSRIVYKKLEKNLGISENTNECIKMSSGEYIALFDHDDLLHPSVLYYYMKEICEKNADFIYCDELTFEEKKNNITVIHHKPDFAIDNLRANNYICHLTTFKKSLLKQVGMFRKEFDGSQDHDLVLRLTEKAESICHVPKILYFWRAHKNSVAKNIGSKSYAVDAGKKAVGAHLDRCGIKYDEITSTISPSMYKIKYTITKKPLVSILIPNMDSVPILKTCVDSIVNFTSYENYEIVIIENNSKKPETFEYYKELRLNPKIKIIPYKANGRFNYSKINNYGMNFCSGEHIILLNNDIEVMTENWIEEMLMYSQRPDVGIVGAMLYYPNNTVQHAGVILGVGGIAGHAHKNFPKGHGGYMGRMLYAHNLSAVTAACLMFKKSIFEEVSGLDEKNFAVAFNDVDLCLKVRELGYLVCFTPFAELYHHESISRGYEDDIKKINRFNAEIKYFEQRWEKILTDGDPYYNINLTKDRDNFDIIPPKY
ncbi:MAG: glycosyltransferase [Clostridia bacterium]